MTFLNILYRNGANDQKKRPSEPPYFKDLNLDQVVAGILRGKEDIPLKELYYSPLDHAEDIRYRQDIMRDFENAVLRREIKHFSESVLEIEQAITAIYEKMNVKDVHSYKYLSLGRILAQNKKYIETVDAFCAALPEYAFLSQGMRAFAEYIAGYAHSDAFKSLSEETRSLRSEIASAKFNMLVFGGSVKVREYEGEPDHNIEVERLFAKFKHGEVETADAKPDQRAYQEFVEEHILELIKKYIPDSFAHLEKYCDSSRECIDSKILEFSRDIRFYLYYLDYLEPLKTQGLAFCYPEICTDTKDIKSSGCFDIALAQQLLQSDQKVVSNDFYLTGEEHIIIVSGPNQGGKTTFARAFGQIHHLALIGCCVAGSEATLYLTDRIFTHFEREENHESLTGKLQDDLIRFRDILSCATERSIIIINEILASTSLKDAVFIGKKFMDQMIRLGPICVCVTFLTELASYTNHTVSMVSQVVPGDPMQRTFKLVRQEADGLAYATHIAGKYGLTFERVRERITV